MGAFNASCFYAEGFEILSLKEGGKSRLAAHSLKVHP